MINVVCLEKSDTKENMCCVHVNIPFENDNMKYSQPKSKQVKCQTIFENIQSCRHESFIAISLTLHYLWSANIKNFW